VETAANCSICTVAWVQLAGPDRAPTPHTGKTANLSRRYGHMVKRPIEGSQDGRRMRRRIRGNLVAKLSVILGHCSTLAEA